MINLTKNLYVNLYAFCGIVIACLLCLGFLSLENAIAYTTTSSNSGSGSNNTSVGTVAWTNTNNIITSGTPYTTSNSIAVSASTNYLYGSSYVFSIPPRATIDGIEVTIKKQASGSGAVQDSIVKIVKGGVVSGNNKAVSDYWSSTGSGLWTTTVYGGPTDKWGLTLSRKDVKLSSFGVVISAINNGVSSKTALIDYMEIKVYYTPELVNGNNFLGNLDDNGEVNSASVYSDTTTGIQKTFSPLEGWLKFFLGLIISFIFVKFLVMTQKVMIK
jgi:hypothetical protein